MQLHFLDGNTTKNMLTIQSTAMPCLLSHVKPYGNNPHSKSLLFLYLYANKNNRRGWSRMPAEKWGGRTLLPSPP